ncbi:MAG: tail fiber domain-containing protein [Patescibacteria group bacterium]|nr:MAG: tail fiber domain-containing protein [Patescibacteria group bacterium]
MRIDTTGRKIFVSLVALIALVFGARGVHAQFAAPTCTPPNCSPAVIQNIPITSAAQNASINVTGDGKLGATFQAGASTPVLNASGQNLYYGNVSGTSTAGSLMLLQVGAADRFRVGIDGAVTTSGPITASTGSVSLPAYTFSGDPNTGLYWASTDNVSVTTGGVQRLTVNNGGVAVTTGALYVPVGSVGAPGYTFAGDSNTGIYHPSADTMTVVTNGVRSMTYSSTNSVVVPGRLHVQGGLDAALGGDGSGITNINANNITSGTLNDARLSSNVALLNNTQTFTGAKTFNTNTTFNNVSGGTVMSITNQVGGIEVYGTGENAFNQYADGSMYYRIDADNDSSNAYYWLAGDNSQVMSLNENGTVDIEGMVMFGGPDVRLLNPGENLIYGNVDQFAGGYIMLLQAENTDRFSVDVDGNVSAAGTIYSGGQAVCLANGVNCQAGIEGTGEQYRLAKFTVNGSVVGNSNIWDNGATIGVGGAPDASYAMRVYGVFNANSISVPVISVNNAGAGATPVQVVASGAASTGIMGSGQSTGVYGISPVYGVYGYSTTSGAGVYGGSSSGWGGDFTSLRVSSGLALFSSGAQIGNGASLILGLSANDIGGTNGRMYYNTTTNKFRCFENGAWQDCRDGGMAGSGSVNTIPKFTAATTLGNSTLTDDGATVTAAQNFAVNGNTTIGNAALDTLTITGSSVAIPNSLNIDSNTLYIDAANNRVGIGLAGPGSTLTVNGTFWVADNATLGNATTDRTTIGGELVLGSMGVNPAGVNGMLYYNSINNKLRCYEGGTWNNCGAEEDTLDTVAARGRQINNYIGISNTGVGFSSFDTALSVRGTVGGVSAVVQAGGTALYGAGGSIGVNGAGTSYGGYFGSSQSGGTALYAQAFQSYDTALYAQGRVRITDTLGVNGAAAVGGWGIQTTGSIYGLYATSGSTGVYASGSSRGLHAVATTSGGYGVYSVATAVGSGINYAGVFTAANSSTQNTAIHASASGATAWGIYVASGGAAKPGGGSWSATSDERLKKDVTPYTNGLSVIREINPVNYTYNGLGGMPEGYKSVGVIAQELQKVAPSMVRTDYRKLKPEDTTRTEVYMVDPSDFTYISINAIKELDQEVQAQAKEIDALRAELNELKALIKN